MAARPSQWLFAAPRQGQPNAFAPRNHQGFWGACARLTAANCSSCKNQKSKCQILKKLVRLGKMNNKFTSSNYHSICDELALRDPDLAIIIQTYGHPPFWSRPNTFETLVHVILEQQVSLASALSALNKLKERLAEIIPERLLLLTDEEMRACYVSRQKAIYLRHLAQALATGQLNLDDLENMEDAAIRAKLTALKG